MKALVADGVGHQPGADDVELDHGAKALRRDRLRRAQELAAGVVDEHVDAPVALEHAVDERARPPPRRGCPSPRPRRCRPALDRRRPSPPAARRGARSRPRSRPAARARAPSRGRARCPRRRRRRPVPSSRPGAKMRELCGRHRARRLYGYSGGAMKVRADTEAARRAAPGGPAGRHRRGRAVLTGTRSARAPSSRAPASFPALRMLGHRHAALEVADDPVPAFLVHHPSAGPFLVDTGLHPSVGPKPAENLGRLTASLGQPELEPGEDLPAQLRARGVDPKAIRLVVMTHMHFDHTSGMSRVPAARPSCSPRTSGSGGHDRLAPAPARLPPRALRLRLRLPHDQLRRRRGRAPTRPSAAPSTSSATAASGSPRPPATAPATSR